MSNLSRLSESEYEDLPEYVSVRIYNGMDTQRQSYYHVEPIGKKLLKRDGDHRINVLNKTIGDNRTLAASIKSRSKSRTRRSNSKSNSRSYSPGTKKDLVMRLVLLLRIMPNRTERMTKLMNYLTSSDFIDNPTSLAKVMKKNPAGLTETEIEMLRSKADPQLARNIK